MLTSILSICDSIFFFFFFIYFQKSFRLRSDGSVGGMSTGTSNMPTTPRFAFDQSAVVKDGVLFISAENNRKDIGPGYYSYSTDTLNKPSFNVRAKSANRGSMRKSGGTVYQNSNVDSQPRSSSSGRFRVGRDRNY
jgi:hypothetical protein